ncbi:hypothetical protein M758_6G083500 [Ceratodon purpureus]|nr:hypothetical protein M758_6G083500 [Ceratodon purpureus]
MARISRTTSYSSDSGGSQAGSPGPSTRPGSKTYMCKVCGNEFSSGQSLGGHMNVHRRDQRSPSSSHSGADYHSPGTDHQSGQNDWSQSYKGVRYRKEQNKWVAEIRPPKANRTWWLGTYSTAREAAYAYDVAITYFGSETSLNFDGHPIYEQIPKIDTDLPNQDFAAQLRKVVKKYGKMAMESGAGPSTGYQEEIGRSSDRDQAGHQPQVLSWEDFPTTLPPPDSTTSDYNPFNVDDMMPQADPSEYNYQGQVNDSEASLYYGYGYQQQYGWPPYNPRDYS